MAGLSNVMKRPSALIAALSGQGEGLVGEPPERLTRVTALVPRSKTKRAAPGCATWRGTRLVAKLWKATNRPSALSEKPRAVVPVTVDPGAGWLTSAVFPVVRSHRKTLSPSGWPGTRSDASLLKAT